MCPVSQRASHRPVPSQRSSGTKHHQQRGQRTAAHQRAGVDPEGGADEHLDRHPGHVDQVGRLADQQALTQVIVQGVQGELGDLQGEQVDERAGAARK